MFCVGMHCGCVPISSHLLFVFHMKTPCCIHHQVTQTLGQTRCREDTVETTPIMLAVIPRPPLQCACALAPAVVPNLSRSPPVTP